MKTIAIIGAGQLGSRHLQGVLKSELNFKVFVIDPNLASIEVARIRSKEIAHNHEVYFKQEISELPLELNLVIVATNSDVRLNIIKKLISQSIIETLILEKVLFQALCEYKEALELFEESPTTVLVNHPRRMQELYLGLRHFILGCPNEHFEVEFIGHNWGIGCNALHVSDIVEFLFDDFVMSYDCRHLDREILQSKRNNFIEFSGKLIGTTHKGHNITLVSYNTIKNHQSYPQFTIKSPSVSIEVKEGSSEIIISTKKPKTSIQTMTFTPLLFQSDLSKIIADKALKGQIVGLTSLNEACRNHMSFVSCLINHLESINYITNDKCPIT
jgi:hypothetical protein